VIQQENEFGRGLGVEQEGCRVFLC